MKQFNRSSIGILFLSIFGLFSCVNESSNTLENDPYFDLRGFIEEKIQEVDGIEVRKDSKIQGEEKQADVIFFSKDWDDELKVFTDADINRVSLLQSYDTTSSDELLTHELLPKAEGKVKLIKVTYFEDEVSSVSIKIAEKNLFYTSTTLADLYMNNATHQIDHYSIETTQKVWFMEENYMKIKGEVK